MSHHNAPPVNYPLGRSRFLALCLSLAWLSAAAVTLAWWLSAAPGDLRPGWGGAALLLSAWALLGAWHRSPAGLLQWDGQHWFWQSQAYPSPIPVHAPEVALDAQRVLLLRVRHAAGPGWWLWVEQRSAPAHWLDLRRAVHARAASADLLPPADSAP